MAAGGPVAELCEELTCPICLDYFRDPVSLAECGHNFCRACLSRSWAEAAAEASCPQCRAVVLQRDLKPNRQLANIVDIAEKMSLLQEGRKTEAKRGICEAHREPLKLFCCYDEAPICVVCDRSKEHRDHAVLPVEEAAQEYQEDICCHLEVLEKKKTEILQQQADITIKGQDMLRQIEEGKEKMLTEFRKMHQFLKEQEELLLAQVNEVEKEVVRENAEQLARLSTEFSSLESFISEIEEQIQQPAADFLQDVNSALQRCDEKNRFTNPVAFISKLKWRIWEVYNRNQSLEVNLKLFKDTLPSQLQVQKAAKVILDPNTANPYLLLSKDQKSVRHGSKTQELPKHPERFDRCPVVLGCEGFMEGCHFWEFIVGSNNGWSVGVVKKTVNRKDLLTLRPEGGIWAVGGDNERLFAFTCSMSPLCLSGELKRIRVCLNHPDGRVAFFDGDRNTLLYEFSDASFQGETIFPFFHVYENGHICLLP